MFCEGVVMASRTKLSRPSRVTAKSDGPELIKSDGPELIKSDGVRSGSRQYDFVLEAS